MQCPKCTTGKMIPENSFSRSSSLHAVAVSTPISGYKCNVCGSWKEAEFVPVCPMPAKYTPPERKVITDVGVKCVNYRRLGKTMEQEIRDRFKEIKKLRDKGTKWTKIHLELGLKSPGYIASKYYNKITAEKASKGGKHGNANNR